MVTGITEINNKSLALRREHDTKEVFSIFNKHPIPLKVLRLDKYGSNKTRYLKPEILQ